MTDKKAEIKLLVKRMYAQGAIDALAGLSKAFKSMMDKEPDINLTPEYIIELIDSAKIGFSSYEPIQQNNHTHQDLHDPKTSTRPRNNDQ